MDRAFHVQEGQQDEREREAGWAVWKRATSVIRGSVRKSHRTKRTTDEPPDRDKIIIVNRVQEQETPRSSCMDEEFLCVLWQSHLCF